MSKYKREGNKLPTAGLNLSAVEALLDEPKRTGVIGYVQRHWIGLGAIGLALLLGVGVMAKNGWLPRTDAMSGKRTGWFGRELPKNAPSSWNPFFPTSSPTPTPQLSKEYIYAGSRLLAVEDANASAVPPEDLAVWRPETGVWYVLGGPGSQQTSYTWGQNNDDPVEGDYDGDGKTDFAVFRPSTNYWWIARSSDNSSYSVSFGSSGDITVPADFDGDGKTDVAVWRPSTYYWYFQPSSSCTPTCSTSYYPYGTASDVPVPADFDGDGKADIAVWRNSNHTFYSVNSSNGQTVSVSIGNNGDKPVCGDYDGDGKANYAVKHGADWIIMNSALTSTTTTSWQDATDIPVQNDYDGDGKVDIAVWRNQKNGTWFIRQSHDASTRTEYWGTTDDIPVPAYYRR